MSTIKFEQMYANEHPKHDGNADIIFEEDEEIDSELAEALRDLDSE